MALSLKFLLTVAKKIMYLYAAFYADYTAYAYGFCYVLLANLSCKLSLVSWRFQWSRRYSEVYSCLLGCHQYQADFI